MRHENRDASSDANRSHSVVLETCQLIVKLHAKERHEKRLKIKSVNVELNVLLHIAPVTTEVPPMHGVMCMCISAYVVISLHY